MTVKERDRGQLPLERSGQEPLDPEESGEQPQGTAQKEDRTKLKVSWTQPEDRDNTHNRHTHTNRSQALNRKCVYPKQRIEEGDRGK